MLDSDDLRDTNLESIGVYKRMLETISCTNILNSGSVIYTKNSRDINYYRLYYNWEYQSIK